MKASLTLFVWLHSLVLSYSDNSHLIYATKGGSFTTRVLCDFVIQCTSEATDIFWSFSGVATALKEDESRYTNKTSSVIEGNKKVFVSSLVMSPVMANYESAYSCNVQGSSSTVVPFTIQVDSDIIDVSIADVDLSSHKVGDKVLVKILVETCLSDFTVSVYKGREVVFNGAVTNNRNPSVSMIFPLLVEKNSGGEYGVRVIAKEVSTALVYFNATGSPLTN